MAKLALSTTGVGWGDKMAAIFIFTVSRHFYTVLAYCATLLTKTGRPGIYKLGVAVSRWDSVARDVWLKSVLAMRSE